MTHSLGEGLALDVDQTGDHTAHFFCTDRAGLRVPHASGVILGCEPTGLYPLQRIDCGSYSATEKQRNSGSPLPRATL